MRGRHDPNLKGVREYSNLGKVSCNVEEEHIAAEQIFPLIRTELWYTPTIKHHCPRVALASSLRACSNKVTFDPSTQRRYARWFREVFIPRFVKLLDEEVDIEVDFEKWLLKYPEAYRMKLRQALSRDKRNFKGECDMRYEAFTKVELQFTDVPHDLKETPANETKERQICGPTDEKKCLANAFINKLEELASKYYKPYCGRANWIQICKDLEKIEAKYVNPIWGASDGSGFDMTQFPEMNELMNELILTAARHDAVKFSEEFDYEDLKEALQGSLTLKVGIDHGDLKYEAVGRASGDGWTTFGNTMLMISYWAFTFEEIAGIQDYDLKVKGDDVLFALNRHQLAQLKQAIPIVFTSRKDDHAHGLGQICKKVMYGDIEEMDFLSNEFFRTKEGNIRMTRIPARVIQTLSWSTRVPKTGRRKEAIRKELCFSKGACLEAWASGLPIFGVLAKKMKQLGVEGKASEWNQYSDADRVWHQNRDDYDAYMQYLQERYGMTPSEVKDIENRINKLSTLTGVLDAPALEKFYAPARS
jgi:hypothetical protein